MTLSKQQSDYIQQVIKACLRNKFQNYAPESSSMPFHFRLLGKDRMALYSFIHSLNTSFGTSIFEPVAVALASNKFRKAHSQHILGTSISELAQSAIQQIINNLTVGNSPDKQTEIKTIKKVSRPNYKFY